MIYLYLTHIISNLEAQSDERNDESYIGERVAKFFVDNDEDRYFCGSVIEFDPELKFFIKYDDNDSEHVDLSALKNMLDLYAVYEENAESAKRNIRDILWEAAKKVFPQYCWEVVIPSDEFVQKVSAVNNVKLTVSRIKLIKTYLDHCYKG